VRKCRIRESLSGHACNFSLYPCGISAWQDEETAWGEW
jgi:hypothetical protein